LSSNRKGYYGWEDQRNPRAGYKGTRGGLAVCISACDDDGNAADTSVSYACMHLFVTFSDTPSKILSMIG